MSSAPLPPPPPQVAAAVAGGPGRAEEAAAAPGAGTAAEAGPSAAEQPSPLLAPPPPPAAAAAAGAAPVEAAATEGRRPEASSAVAAAGQPHPTRPEEAQEVISCTASGSGSVIGRDPLPPRAVSAASIQQQQLKGGPPPSLALGGGDDLKVHAQPPSPYKKPASPLPPPPPVSDAAPAPSPGPGPGAGGGGGGGGRPAGAVPNHTAAAPGPPPFGQQAHDPPPKEHRDHLADAQGKRGPLGLNVSAGELLGRTHEELVLLLIKLRRQSAGVCKAMENCHMEIEAQARLADLETPKRLEHLRKLEELKKHLLDLEKQYEKGKPLVNLVDNMVKLGSLYRGSAGQLQTGLAPHDPMSMRERLEFNQKLQEQRLLADERRDWERMNPADHTQLQAKVQELYRLDRLLQEESGTLQSLQQNKELLEKALGGVRHKLEVARANPAEAERYRKQQKLLERELSKVRMLLAHNSKKLEETVAENARLEQELVILRQKLQASRRGSQPLQRAPALFTQDGTPVNTTAALEAELRRVQQLVGDLQRQRQELSMQVRHLTEKSHSLVQQIRPGPTGVAGRKRHHSTWLETDLDSMVTLDHGLESPASPQRQTSPPGTKATTSDSRSPLYVNTDANSKREVTEPTYESTGDGGDGNPPPLPAPPEMPPEYPPPPPPPPPPSEEAMMNGSISSGPQYCSQMDISEADDRMKRFYGIIPREKQQEIKTVRIVKRESERRQRDRDRSGNIGIPITNGTGSPGKRIILPDDTDSISTQHLEGSARSRDDLDMERALRPRLNAPDVVRSTMSHKDFKYNEDTIDSILGTPSKIVIPERYIPEQAPELSAEEQLHRSKKADAIRKMLSETTLTSSDGKEPEPEEQTSTLKKKLAAEKKQREHILQLNQILAKQVMEKSKIVAGSTSSVHPQE